MTRLCAHCRLLWPLAYFPGRVRRCRLCWHNVARDRVRVAHMFLVARRERRLTQAQLGRRIGRKAWWFSEAERGVSTVTIPTAERMLARFDSAPQEKTA